MIDTIRIEIHNLTVSQLENIKLNLQTLSKIDNSTGQILSEFTQGTLEGSYDYRIRAFMKDRIYESVIVSQEEKTLLSVRSRISGKITKIKSTKPIKKTLLVSVPEFLVLEFSLAKWSDGHNLLNSSLSQDSLRLSLFRKWLQSKFDTVLPNLENWDVTRVDMAVNYHLFCEKQVIDLIEIYSNLRYPRRRPPQVYQTSVAWSGITKIKFYGKGAEFKVHDYKRLLNIFPKERVKALKDIADNILRNEIEFRKDKLISLGIKKIKDLFSVDWVELMTKEIFTLTASRTLKKPFSYKKAVRLISQHYRSGLKISLEASCAVWVSVSTQGLTYANKTHGRNKVTRARKYFKDIGLPCVSNFTEIKVESEDLDITQYDSNDSDLRFKITNIIPFPLVEIENDEFNKVLYGTC